MPRHSPRLAQDDWGVAVQALSFPYMRQRQGQGTKPWEEAFAIAADVLICSRAPPH